MKYNYLLLAVLDRYARSEGIKEIIYFDIELIPKGYYGLITYERARIKIDCPTLKDTILSLIHEIGHWLAYKRHNKKYTGLFHYKKYREKMAYLYGWFIIKKFKLNISKNTWRWFNSRNIAL